MAVTLGASCATPTIEKKSGGAVAAKYRLAAAKSTKAVLDAKTCQDCGFLGVFSLGVLEKSANIGERKFSRRTNRMDNLVSKLRP